MTATRIPDNTRHDGNTPLSDAASIAAGTDSPMMIAVVVATGNRDKVLEIMPLLDRFSALLKVFSLGDLSLSPNIEETETTLEGNAHLKAETVLSLVGSRFASVIVLADDTGLEVDALDGEPGVYSARFAPTAKGYKPTYDENVAHLLFRMKGKPERLATFRTVIAMKGRLQSPAGGGTLGIDETFEGSVRGEITMENRGTGGFGYDPVFRVLSTGTTYAEMSLEEKNQTSHRALALQKAIGHIDGLMARIVLPPTEHNHS